MSLAVSGFLQQIVDAYDALPESGKQEAAERATNAPEASETCKRCRDTFYGAGSVLNEAGYCPDCQKCIDRGYDIAEKAGRCANGGQLDGGVVFHAILMDDDNGSGPFEYSRVKAACSTRPGNRSVGWSNWKPEDRKVTCERCLARLEKLGLT